MRKAYDMFDIIDFYDKRDVRDARDVYNVTGADEIFDAFMFSIHTISLRYMILLVLIIREVNLLHTICTIREVNLIIRDVIHTICTIFHIRPIKPVDHPGLQITFLCLCDVVRRICTICAICLTCTPNMILFA